MSSAPEVVPPPSWRTALISAFLVVHVTAMLWWNFAVVGLPQQEPQVAPGLMRAVRSGGEQVRDVVDRGHVVGGGLETYVNWTGTWQYWWMFAPDVTRFRSYLVLYGIQGWDEQGRAILAEEPILATDTETYEEWFMRNSHSECGWRLPTDPRDRVMVDAFVRYQLEVHERETGEHFVGGRYVCHLAALPGPAGEMPEDEPHLQRWTLWETAPEGAR